MDFNPYQYNGYPNYYTPQMQAPMNQMRQTQMQQPMPNMMQQGQQMQGQPLQPVQPTIPSGNAQNNGIIWVSSKLEADNYLVAPNSAVALWDANNPVIYLRQADSTGKPMTKVYDLVERTDEQPKPQQPAQKIDLSNYVTWDSFEERVEQILSERLKKQSRTSKSKEDKEE